MKKPKPNNNRPQLWIGYNNYDFRLRILYPGGKTEWTNNNPLGLFYKHCCWNRPFGSLKICHKDIKTMVKEMKLYDKSDYRKTEFVGNL